MFQATTDSKLDPKNKVEVLIIPLFEYKQLFESDKQFMLFTFIDWISMGTAEKDKSTKISSFPFVMYFLDRINIMYMEQLLLTCVHKLIAFRLSYNQIRQAEKRFCSPQKLGTHRIIYRGFVCVDFYGEHGETVNDLAMDEMAIENIRDEDYFLESCFLWPE